MNEESNKTRKWNQNSENKVKGKLSNEEKHVIFKELCRYSDDNNISFSDIIELINNKQKRSSRSLYTNISEKLPNRSVKSIHDFLQRALANNNYKGIWSNADIENLIEYVNTYGNKWVKISKLLDRTPMNVKDKYKEIGGKNKDYRDKIFNLIDIVLLIKTISDYTKINLLKYEVSFVNTKGINKEINNNNSKKLLDNSKSINLENNYFTINNNVCYIDSNISNETSEKFIINILLKIISFTNLENLIVLKKEISFTIVSDILKNKSYDDCKNCWQKLITKLYYNQKKLYTRDLNLINSVIDQDRESIEEVDFKSIIENSNNNYKLLRNENICKLKLKQIIESVDLYKIGDFKSLLRSAKLKIEKELDFKNNNTYISNLSDKDKVYNCIFNK